MQSILIVGSGVAGALAARQLLATGGDHEITMFEAGPDFEAGSYRRWLDYLMAGTNPYERFMDDPPAENPSLGLRGSRLFMKGGTTNHWGGWCLRFKPEDFELETRTGMGADWPISYEALAPYYAQAEVLLGVEGDSEDDDPRRYGARFPFEAAPYTLNDMPVIEALESLSMSYSHMPLARNADRCITTGTCRVCPVNARYSATFDLFELKNEYGDKLDIRTESPVSRILMDGKRRARGVSFVDRETGRTDSMEGDAVVVCSGTFESTKLLLASANADWPDGIGNDSGHLGRHLIGHPLISAEGFRPGNPERAEQELGFVTLACRHFDTQEFQKEGKMLFAREDNRSKTFLEREILANVSRSDLEKKMDSGVHLAFYASIEQFESPENRVSLGTGTDKFGLRATEIEFGINETAERALETHAQNLIDVLKAVGCDESSIRAEGGGPTGAHMASTCRMSASDADGVVDENLRVHGTENLYVCSNAVFPNVTSVNPTLSLGALAVRLADHVDTA